MGGGVRLNGHHRPGGRRVYGEHTAPAAGKRLAAQHAIAGLHAQFTFGANVLLQRNHKTLGERNLTQRCTVRLRFHFGRVNATVEIPDFVFSEGGE